MSQRRRRATRCQIEELEGRAAPSIVVTQAVLDTRHPLFIKLDGYTTSPTGGKGRSHQVLTIVARQPPTATRPQVIGSESSIQLKSPAPGTPSGATGSFQATIYAAHGSTWDKNSPQIDVQAKSTDPLRKNEVVETSQQTGLPLQRKT